MTSFGQQVLTRNASCPFYACIYHGDLNLTLPGVWQPATLQRAATCLVCVPEEEGYRTLPTYKGEGTLQPFNHLGTVMVIITACPLLCWQINTPTLDGPIFSRHKHFGLLSHCCLFYLCVNMYAPEIIPRPVLV